jgi:putative membrane protein
LVCLPAVEAAAICAAFVFSLPIFVLFEIYIIMIMTFLKGMAMGIAEVIPGVSGGTIAFITGIFERLLTAIRTILSAKPLQLWRSGGFSALWQGIDGKFIVLLLGGMATGVVTGIFTITYLLEHYPPVIWAFFFGLIIASVVYVLRQVRGWKLAELLSLLAGALFAYWITVSSPMQGSESLLVVFFSGMIAICALMLPGISGSFVLLLLGMYTFVIGSLKAVLSSLDPASLQVVVVFALGCLGGMAFFSRILTWTLQHFHNATMAMMAGFMFGSLNKLWPWRNVLTFRTNSKGEKVPFQEANVLPEAYAGEPYVLAAVAAIVAGIVLVLLLERMGDAGKTKS